MKAAGNYRSLIRGVSEQAPELRPEGQVTEQVNMIPDPVQGLSRRWGSVFKASKDMSIDPTSTLAAMVADTATWRTFDYFSQGTDYTICLRRTARPVGSTLPVCVVYNRTTNTFLSLARNVTDADLDLLESGGASAVTNVGKYVFMAGNTVVPANSSTDLWGSNANLQKSVLWIRGGAYGRTYKATATKLDGTHISFEYKTPVSSYPGTLDTSGVPYYLPDVTGAGSGSTPTSLAAVEYPNVLTLVVGGTYTLTHTSGVSNILVSFQMGTGEDSVSGQYVEGIDYTYNTGTHTFTWLASSGEFPRGVEAFNVNNSNSVSIFYRYTTSGSTTTVAYATQTDVEAPYIKKEGANGYYELGYADWTPSSLTIKLGAEPMTNSYPALPGVGEFSWAPNGRYVLFNVGLVGNPFALITYTHYKTIPNPNYTKQIGDITNDYNTAVTKWIGSAAEAIQPNNIAEQLRLAAVAAGLTTATRQASTIIFDNVKSITADDGGDGSLIRGVADEVGSVDAVSTIHAVGKVVKVRGKNSKESFYLKATAKDRTVTSGYTEVIWVEGAGTAFTITAGLIYGTAVGSTFYLASSAAKLDLLTTGPAPAYETSIVGDEDTNPIPYFIGKVITYLGVFQDRLLVGSGGVIRASKTGEYLNFFRSTVLTLPADDALEFLSQGAADDELRYSVLYDQSLVLFGKNRQYLINGKQPLTPTNANMVPMSNHKDAGELPPLAAGGFIFYAKKGPSSSSVHQIQPGLSTSPESFIISSQIDLYLQGAATELQQIAKPSTLFLRTAGSRNSVYCFSYLDVQDGRRQDAWHRWDYDTSLGPVIGIQPTSEGLLIFHLRTGTNHAGTAKTWVVADLQVMTTGLSTYPYLDSIQPIAAVAANTGPMHTTSTGKFVAFDRTSEWQFLGDSLANYVALQTTFPSATGLWAGTPYTAIVTPTNPFKRDQDGHAVTTGRLTVTKFDIAFSLSGGYVYDVVSEGDTETTTFNGRVIGDPHNIIGREPISTYHRTMTIGKETRAFDFTVKSRKWFPMTITSVAWVGQYFNRTQGIG